MPKPRAWRSNSRGRYWEKEEARRLAEAKAGWQKEADAALGRAQTTAEHSRAAESELRALKDELAALRTELAAREAALTEMRAAQTKTERDAEAGLREALRKAEDGWKVEEETRLAAAKAAWQKETEAALAKGARPPMTPAPTEKPSSGASPMS